MATQRFAPELTQIVIRAGSTGASLSAAAKAMAAKQGFTHALRQQRMTFRQFVDAHGSTVETKGAATRVFVPQRAERRQTPQETFMRYAQP